MRNSNVLLPYALSLLALVCIGAMLFTHQQEYIYGGTRYDIRIVNGFSDNSSLPLVIWCGSKDGDMGGRALQERDDYSWTLETTRWPWLTWLWGEDYGAGGNEVHCTMKWDQKRKRFDAFHAVRDIQRCKPLRMCLWLVKEDGFYFSNDGFYYHKEFTWP